MLQKVIKVGNSLAVTMPSEFIKQSGLKSGDKILVETSMKTLTLTADLEAETGLTPEFDKSVRDFIKKYKPALKALAKK